MKLTPDYRWCGMARCYRFAALMLLSVVFAGCGDDSTTGPGDDSGTQVVEIREYEGQQLSSTTSMRENSLRGPQHVDTRTWRLEVEGLVASPREFTYDELLERERVRRVVWTHCVEGWSVKILWEGFSLSSLFDELGVKSAATHALFYAVDGYSTYLTLDYIRANDIIAATHANGNPLSAARGFPLFIISLSKYGYKWCKWVNRIVLTDGPEGAGFYESAGYSHDGNVGDHSYDPDTTRLTP